MSQKPDFYEVLGVEKTASEADIKKAFMRITMTCHPDSAPYKKLNDAQKAEADTKFMYGKEAQAVLTDPVKRATYDRLGHAGLDASNNGSTPSPGWSDAMGPVKKRTRTQEETFDYFDRAAVRNGDAPSTSKPADNNGPALSEEEMRAAARAARRRGRGQDNAAETVETPAAEVPPPAAKVEPKPETRPQFKPVVVERPAEKPLTSGAASIFEGVAGKMTEAAGRLRDAVKADANLPVEALEKFRDNLQDLIGEVDQAIHHARRSGPKGGYNR